MGILVPALPLSIANPDKSMIRFQCAKCGKQLNAQEEHVGRKVKCSKCDNVILVPQLQADVPFARLANTTPTIRVKNEILGWHVNDGSKTHGPIDDDELRRQLRLGWISQDYHLYHAMHTREKFVKVRNLPAVFDRLGLVMPIEREPVLTPAAWSFILLGLGQIGIGQRDKGLAILGCSILILIITAGIGALIIYPLVLLDAYMSGKLVYNGKSIGKWEFFPS